MIVISFKKTEHRRNIKKSLYELVTYNIKYHTIETQKSMDT